MCENSKLRFYLFFYLFFNELLLGYAGFFKGILMLNGISLQASDEKLKENIRNLPLASATVKRLQPKEYDLVSERGNTRRRKHFGLIAQDVESVLPDLVFEVQQPGKTTSEDKKIKVTKIINEKQPDGKYIQVVKEVEEIQRVVKEDKSETIKAVNYTEIIALLLQTVKEQQAVIEQLQIDVETLKRR